jgi:hypothetical protein
MPEITINLPERLIERLQTMAEETSVDVSLMAG